MIVSTFVARVCLLVVLCTFLFGCAETMKNVPSTYNLSPSSNVGVIVFSTTQSGTYEELLPLAMDLETSAGRIAETEVMFLFDGENDAHVSTTDQSFVGQIESSFSPSDLALRDPRVRDLRILARTHKGLAASRPMIRGFATSSEWRSFDPDSPE